MVEIKREGQEIVIKPSVSMIMAHTDAIKNHIKAEVFKDGHGDASIERIVLDLKGVGLMDSTGVGVLITIKKLADLSNRTFQVINPNAVIQRVLRITKMYDYMNILDKE